MNSNQNKRIESTGLWMAKTIAGLLIIVLLGIHFVVNHLVAPGGLLSYADVLKYYQNPIIPSMEGFFLVFVVSHALLGLRSILLDLNFKPSLQRGLDILLVVLGSAATIYGIWLLIFLSNR